MKIDLNNDPKKRRESQETMHGEILNWEEVTVGCAFQRQRLDAETHLLSVLKLSLQGTTVFKVADKVGVLKAQLDFLERRVDRGVCETLQTLARARDLHLAAVRQSPWCTCQLPNLRRPQAW